jgi:hypothetical protein
MTCKSLAKFGQFRLFYEWNCVTELIWHKICNGSSLPLESAKPGVRAVDHLLRAQTSERLWSSRSNQGSLIERNAARIRSKSPFLLFCPSFQFFSSSSLSIYSLSSIPQFLLISRRSPADVRLRFARPCGDRKRILTKFVCIFGQIQRETNYRELECEAWSPFVIEMNRL